MKQLFGVILVVVLLVGCGGAPTPAAPTAQPIPDVPGNVKLPGMPLGGGGLRVGDYAVWLSSADAPATGNAQLDALVLDKNNQPVTDAAVSFDIDMTNMSHGKNVIKTAAAGDGHYAGQVHFMMSGPWRVIVVVERPNQSPVNARFNFNVK